MPGEYDIVINIQGDEPLIDPHVIDDVVKALQESPDSVYRSDCCSHRHQLLLSPCIDQPCHPSSIKPEAVNVNLTLVSMPMSRTPATMASKEH